MGLGHEKLDVRRLSIGLAAWVYEKTDGLNCVHRDAIGGAQDDFDTDPDSDFDLEKRMRQPVGSGDSQSLAPDPRRYKRQAKVCRR
jgi:hypothetical protein